jgi:feruloyl esterase
VAPVNAESTSNVVVIAPPMALARGYVVYSSDATVDWGDKVYGALFKLTEELRRNGAGAPLKKTHDAALWLVRRWYGRLPTHNYFAGCSSAGLESLLVIRKFPQDYDGVITNDPDISLTGDALRAQFLRRAQALNHGAGYLSPAKGEFLYQAELKACDKLDGLEDGIISNVAACKMDFNVLRCPGGLDTARDCLSDAQLATVKLMHSPMRLSYALADGAKSLGGWPMGVNWSHPAVAASAPFPLELPGFWRFADYYLSYFVMREPQAGTLSFDPANPGRYTARVQEISAFFDQTSPDIDGFIARGGKWILVHGAADQMLPVGTSIEHYRKIVARYGQAATDKFVRFYVVPGYTHAGGGSAFNANGAPVLEALDDWVEHGVAPGTLTVVDANPAAHGRSRPMCVYPGWPKYNGSGDPNLASSFSCVLQ